MQLQEQVRAGDAIYRFGGDEFLCVFPEQSLETGAQVVERMRAKLEEPPIPHLGNPIGVVTFSAGLAILDPGHIESAKEVLQEADAALLPRQAARSEPRRAGHRRRALA